MANELVLNNTCFVELNDSESINTSGGAVVVPILIGVGLVANEVVERTTGKSIVTYVGEGIKSIGVGLKEAGNKLWQ